MSSRSRSRRPLRTAPQQVGRARPTRRRNGLARRRLLSRSASTPSPLREELWVRAEQLRRSGPALVGTAKAQGGGLSFVLKTRRVRRGTRHEGAGPRASPYARPPCSSREDRFCIPARRGRPRALQHARDVDPWWRTETRRGRRADAKADAKSKHRRPAATGLPPQAARTSLPPAARPVPAGSGGAMRGVRLLRARRPQRVRADIGRNAATVRLLKR